MPTITIGENTGDTYTGITDTQIKENAPTTNYASGLTMEATSYGASDKTWSIIRVAPPSLGGSIVVSSATLYLNQQSAETGTRTLDLHKLLRGDSAATWNTYDGSNNWQTAGAGGALDFDSSALVTASVTNATGYKSWSSSGLASYVQAQINAASPMLFLLVRNPRTAADSTFNVFYQSNDASGVRPYLSVTYTLGGSNYIMMKGM
jgi:hypothetical protein